MYPVCNSHFFSFCLFSNTLVKSYFCEIFPTLYLTTGLSGSSLCPSRMLIVELMVVGIDRLIDSYFYKYASVNIFMHNAFIRCCLTLFHGVNSQKCNYWVKGLGYFKALNICIMNLTFERIVWVYISLAIHNCTYFTMPSLHGVYSSFLVLTSSIAKNCTLFNLYFCA